MISPRLEARKSYGYSRFLLYDYPSAEASELVGNIACAIICNTFPLMVILEYAAFRLYRIFLLMGIPYKVVQYPVRKGTN